MPASRTGRLGPTARGPRRGVGRRIPAPGTGLNSAAVLGTMEAVPGPGRGSRARSDRRSGQRPPAPRPGSPPRTRSHPAAQRPTPACRARGCRAAVREGAQPLLVELAEEGDSQAVGAGRHLRRRQHQDVRQGDAAGFGRPAPGRPRIRPWGLRYPVPPCSRQPGPRRTRRYRHCRKSR